MNLACIVAMAENGIIGRENRLPWHLPEDLKRFKALTMGHHLIVGRKTYDSIGRPLPGRRMVVLSRDPGFSAPGIQIVRSWDDALNVAVDDPEPFVAGGASLYRMALPKTKTLYLTLVHATVTGDVRFPLEEMHRFRLVDEEPHPADANHPFPFTFRTYRKA